MSIVEKRRASLKLTLLLLYLGVLPLTPDVPLPFVIALVALTLVAAVPLCLRFARTLSQRIYAPVQPSIVQPATPGSWQLLRPVAPGTPGTVRSRAPSGPVVAHG